MAKYRRRLGLQRADPARLAELERTLRGEDPTGLSPHEGAAQLARYREGLRLLARVVTSPGPPALREAAVYGFVFANLKAPHLVLLRRVFSNPHEHPLVRGQAAEALGSQLSSYRHRWQRRYLRIVDTLVRGLDDPAPEVRFWSIYALTGMERSERLLPKLRHIAATDTATVTGMWTLRQEALWAISRIEGGEDLDPRTL
ncbi:MAG TPA: HEAT repeat domain-containing protein [Myxococcus sp.]|jgi:HEAT repeat protein|nr:HEAT repeat domain-containing protein [Myxococcus sp.]